jgi:hypothetical protein
VSLARGPAVASALVPIIPTGIVGFGIVRFSRLVALKLVIKDAKCAGQCPGEHKHDDYPWIDHIATLGS